MNLKLIHPSPSKGEYEGRVWSPEMNDPLLSSLAILAQVVKEQVPGATVSSLGDTKVSGSTIEDYSFRHRTIDEFVDFCADADVVGANVLFHNLDQAIKIAERYKKRNPEGKFVLGGMGVTHTPRHDIQILKDGPLVDTGSGEPVPAIDYIVEGNGEQSIVELLRGKSKLSIPNLVHRVGKEVVRNHRVELNLNSRPYWDFTSTMDYKDATRAYDSRGPLFVQLRKDSGGSFIGRVGVETTKGCEKTVRSATEKGGPCGYCTSHFGGLGMMDAVRFWKQIENLYQMHGIKEYFLSDNILTYEPKLDALLRGRNEVSLPKDILFRGYGYTPFLTNADGKINRGMFQKLQKLGVVNLFVGFENYAPGITEIMNKKTIPIGTVHNIVETSTEYGIDMFIPLMIGLPGESAQSLEYNLKCLDGLLARHGSRTYGSGGIVRVDLSTAMPLAGTPWYTKLLGIEEVRNEYAKRVGKDLVKENLPNYTVLEDLSREFFHPTGITRQQLDGHKRELQEICLKYLNPGQIGGFDFKAEK